MVEAKKLFKEQFESVSTDEITKMEQSLMEEGMPIEEVQRLCDVHSAVFEGSISDIHKQNDKTEIPGHPIKVFLDENKKYLQHYSPPQEHQKVLNTFCGINFWHVFAFDCVRNRKRHSS